MNINGTGVNTCKECHKTESLWNRTTADHKEGEQLEDWRNSGETICHFGDKTGSKDSVDVYDCDDNIYMYIKTMYIVQHINQNNILTTEQYGFRNNSSNEKASFRLINEILLALNNHLTFGGT